ncbi:Hypothetical Protein MfeM64YM_0644 [Mycoplasmopsis fermentans M64]|uniref:Uncharacterized protein n=1 Tax=Mycoplasmopsis fermentans (strain M64) TaxID=943945 RepID=A0AB32XC96_MYCFM|nr:Hypothetical Protein MfeM64YM_0644 [Mycoplasmopsis fermentans M64]
MYLQKRNVKIKNMKKISLLIGGIVVLQILFFQLFIQIKRRKYWDK